MKNQYVGDVNDYRKYGILRKLIDAGLKLGVLWMLTEDDESDEGNDTCYLCWKFRDQYQNFDPDLYQSMAQLVNVKEDRSVKMVENSKILKETVFISEEMTDNELKRNLLMQAAFDRLNSVELIFFDPDNGLEIKSRKKGNKDSKKFLYFDEVADAYKAGKSLLIYQHYPRIDRKEYRSSRCLDLKKHTGAESVHTISTKNVCFFLVQQSCHNDELASGLKNLKKSWKKEFEIE